MTTAVVMGSSLDPVVRFYFAYDDTHPLTQEPLRDWLKTTFHATFNPDRKTWSTIELPRDADAKLRDAGFVVSDFDGQPCRLEEMYTPVLLPSDHEGLVALYPRMTTKDGVRSLVGDGATWKAEQRCWLVPDDRLDAMRSAGVIDRLGDYTPIDRSVVHNPLIFDGTIDGLRGVPVADLDAIDPLTAVSLANIGITSIYDLLHIVPRRYIDRSHPQPVSQIDIGSTGAFLATIREIKKPPPSATSRGKVTSITVADVTNPTTKVTCRWFNAPYIAKRFSVGQTVLVSGKMDSYSYPGSTYQILQMNNPLMDIVTGDDAEDANARIIGVYPALKDVTTWVMRRAIKEAIRRLDPIIDPIPPSVLAQHNFPSRDSAMRSIHSPNSLAEASAARTRLAYDELMRWQLVIAAKRYDETHTPGIQHTFNRHLLDQLDLPYDLTGAQKRCIREIEEDLRSARPMMRLLQGEVGSGKTLTAMSAAFDVVESGWSAAIMAPSTVLAQQHYDDLIELTENMTKADGSPLRVELLTVKVTGKRRQAVLSGLAAGEVDIVVGTSALLSAGVHIDRLGLVIIDEQHRFGVEQRAELSKRAQAAGWTPDVLVMTATPAPRTAVLTIFGDLDVSVIDEMPPGRQPIPTSIVTSIEKPTDEAWVAISDAIDQGRQAFVVTPLVTTSETKMAAGAEAMADKIRDVILPGRRVGVVHGKQTPTERGQQMSLFANGEIDILVATTVIEVGVNVPNATVMLVTGAESFGIAQLHQIRGRVGRGKYPGQCFLSPSKELVGPDAERLLALCETNDGFKLAQRDLEIRGPGSLAGVKQSGRKADLRIADLVRDIDLIETARDDAATIIAGDHGLRRHPTLHYEIVAALGSEGIASLTTQ